MRLLFCLHCILVSGFACAMPPKEICLALSHEVQDATITSAEGKVKRKVRLALTSTSTTMRCGLAYRKALPSEYEGMIFNFEGREPSMWMENTLIPLDMVFVDAEGLIQCIHAAKPLDRTPIRCARPTVQVVELPGGTCAHKGIKQGDRLMWGQ